mmetsp:Transcript_41705/g.98989  ORF Transcript_41705/g.98989 Transcript_41705/m.98989 type:complete len:266 (-) Transcript_41705:140-937(-)
MMTPDSSERTRARLGEGRDHFLRKFLRPSRSAAVWRSISRRCPSDWTPRRRRSDSSVSARRRFPLIFSSTMADAYADSAGLRSWSHELTLAGVQPSMSSATTCPRRTSLLALSHTWCRRASGGCLRLAVASSHSFSHSRSRAFAPWAAEGSRAPQRASMIDRMLSCAWSTHPCSTTRRDSATASRIMSILSPLLLPSPASPTTSSSGSELGSNSITCSRRARAATRSGPTVLRCPSISGCTKQKGRNFSRWFVYTISYICSSRAL